MIAKGKLRGVATVLFVIVAVIWIGLAATGGKTGSNVSQVELKRHGESNTLVVILHAYKGSSQSMRDVAGVAHKKLPHADILLPDYEASTFANTDLTQLASDLDTRIQEIYDNRRATGKPYDKVVLIGHSTGAVIARKTYLYAKGYRSDYKPKDMRTESNPWAGSVDRIILLAGMNRGWSIDPRPKNMSWATKAIFSAGRTIGRRTGTGELIRSVEKGSPFISNLRVDWIRMIRTNDDVAPVIQLLGDGDEIVSAEDDSDQLAAAGFMFMRVLGAKHANVIDFDDSGGQDAKRRKNKFTEALVEPIAQLKSNYPPSKGLLVPDRTFSHIVFVKHGIRDMGDWTLPFRSRLEGMNVGVKVLVPSGRAPAARPRTVRSPAGCPCPA